MSKTATIYFSANLSGDNLLAGGTIPVSYQITNSPATHIVTNAGPGDNTVQIPQSPTPARYVRILPGGISLTLKGATGDSGVQIDPNNETWLALPIAQTTFILTTGGSCNIEFYFY